MRSSDSFAVIKESVHRLSGREKALHTCGASEACGARESSVASATGETSEASGTCQ